MRYTLQQSVQPRDPQDFAHAAATKKWNADRIEQLVDRCFLISADVRYVAVYAQDNLVLRARDGISGVSAAESDTYAELLAHPVLIKLASQRGDIDCGGLRFLLVRYGHFYQFVCPTPTGHVSVTLAPSADLMSLPNLLAKLIGESS